jgi:hypothetical protein
MNPTLSSKILRACWKGLSADLALYRNEAVPVRRLAEQAGTSPFEAKLN